MAQPPKTIPISMMAAAGLIIDRTKAQNLLPIKEHIMSGIMVL